MTWEIAITVAAIGLLALLHVAFAPPAVPPVAEGPPPAAEGAAWGRWLALAAIAAAVIALAALIVPAVFGGGSSTSTSGTHSTTTIPSTTTTTPSTTTTQPTTTTHSTTTHATTTRPHTTTTTTTTRVTTTPAPAPKGSAVLVRGAVTRTGELAVVQNRLGGSVTAARVSPGVYRIELSDLSAASRRKSVVHVSSGPRTTAVGGWSADGHLVVLVSDRQTGAPAARAFSFVVIGPKHQAALPRTT